mgnify:FL=1
MDEINDYDCDGYRPFHHAILANSISRARDLMRLGALINAPTESGDGALVLTCRALNDDEAAEWIPVLLEWGAEIIDRDRTGRTPLHHACERGLVKTTAALLAGGADPFFKDGYGKKPADYATSEAMRSLFSKKTAT